MARKGFAVTLALSLILLGCQTPEWFQQVRSWGQRSPSSCQPEAVVSGCAPGDLCVRTGPSNTACVRGYIGSTPLVPFPFPPAQAVRCTRGPKETRYADASSHSKAETLFAIDLATPPSAPPGKVHAGLDGVALVHGGCGQEKDKDPSCGGGLGNHVRILHKDGLLALYAHLETVAVEDGQQIHSGTVIGIEGSTGRAGTRHLHFSLHHVVNEGAETEWLESLSRFRSKPGAVPVSIPFETVFCDPARTDACQRKRARVEQLPCGPDSPLLRADWRT